MNLEDRLKSERDFISLLLANRDMVGDWMESGIDTYCFHKDHQMILAAVKFAFSNDVLLTKKTYLNWLQQHAPSRSEIPAYEAQFLKIAHSRATNDDYPMLKNMILDNHMTVMAFAAIEDYRKDQKDGRRGTFSTSDLTKKLVDIVEDQQASEGHVIYESISEYAKDYYDDLIIRKDQPEEENRIKCGIKEIDETMGVGFAAGEMTLFCADMGNFKCCHPDSTLIAQNGSKISALDVYEKFRLGVSLPKVMSFSSVTGKMFYQNIVAAQSNGVKPTYRIKTRSGFETITTDNHPYLTFNGFVELKNLTIGQKIAVTKFDSFGSIEVDKNLAIWLGGMLAEGGTSGLGYTFTNLDPDIVHVFGNACVNLKGNIKQKTLHGEPIEGNYRVNALRKYGIKYELDGKTALFKFIHDEVFQWNKTSLCWLLKTMFSCDGSISLLNNNISYCTSSKKLAQDVKRLLCKFDINSNIFSFMSESGNMAYRVVIYSKDNVQKYCHQIGFIGEKSEKQKQLLLTIESKKSNSNLDIIPSDIWKILDEKFEHYGKSHYGCRRWINGKNTRGKEGHCGVRGKGVNRGLLAKMATYLDKDVELKKIATSDVFWDEIVSVEYVEDIETYDIQMEKEPNFVLDGIITHNTTIMLNIAANIWERGYNVLFVPLEMTREMMYQKFLSRESRIDFEKLVDPYKMVDEEWKNVKEKSDYIANKADNHFYIMEKPEVSVSNLSRLIEKHADTFKPHVVVVDYIGLLTNDSKANKDRYDLQIGEMLKSLRRMGKPNSLYDHGFHIVSGVHIARDALKRVRRTDADKVGFFSEDLSQSSQYSNDATNIYAQFKDPSQPNSRLNLYCIKSRFGKTTFNNGENRTVLSVRPEINLIESINDEWMKTDQVNISKMSEEVESIEIGSDFDITDGFESDTAQNAYADYKKTKEVTNPHESDFSDFDETQIEAL